MYSICLEFLYTEFIAYVFKPRPSSPHVLVVLGARFAQIETDSSWPADGQARTLLVVHGL